MILKLQYWLSRFSCFYNYYTYPL